MTSYTYYNSTTGKIEANYAGENVIEMDKCYPMMTRIDGNYEEEFYYIENENAVEKPVRPTPFHQFDYSTKDWILLTEQLEKAKTKKKHDITNYANWLHLEPIEYDNKLLDADRVAQQNISGKITELQNDIALSITSTNLFWKDADNVVHTWTDAADYLIWLQGLFNAITSRRTNLYTISWQGKAEIDAMTNIEDIQAYSITDLFNIPEM